MTVKKAKRYALNLLCFCADVPLFLPMSFAVSVVTLGSVSAPWLVSPFSMMRHRIYFENKDENRRILREAVDDLQNSSKGRFGK
jgi:hypothetical protein